MSAQQAEQALRSVLDINESLLEKVTSHEVSPVRRPSVRFVRTVVRVRARVCVRVCVCLPARKEDDIGMVFLI